MNRVTRFGRDAVLIPVVLAVIAALAAFSFAAVAPVGAQSASVTIVDFAFDSASIEVAAGTTVTWTNNGAVAHTATGAAFDTGNIAPGGSASFTFDTPGTYSYACSIHPDMLGTIVVTGGGGSAADDDDDGAGGNTTTNLPSTGVGVASGGPAALPLAAALLAAVMLLAVAGAAVLRRADR